MPQINPQTIQDLLARVAALENVDSSPHFHQHTGIDMAKVNFADLQDVAAYAMISVVTLTSAQIKALLTTPIVLVPAQTTASASSTAANSVIIVEGITAHNFFNSAAYTGANALEFRYTDGSGTKVTADMANTFINSASSAYNHVAGITTSFTPVANTPVVVAVPTANPAAGNGTITFITKYRVLNF